MSRFKDFGEGVGASAEPVVFKLHGEEFTCYPNVPGKVLLDLVAKSGDENNPAASAEIVSEFFKVVLTPESYTRFDELARDAERIVTVETLGEIISWLMEEYSDRPTPRPESLPSGQ